MKKKKDHSLRFISIIMRETIYNIRRKLDE
jgi:hypothetical protein